MRSAFTLAHELGHAGHFSLANKAQRIFDTRPSTYFVEAPSTMNEILLANHLMKQDDNPRTKRWVILQILSAGGTLTPEGLLNLAGLDMSTPEPIEAAVNYVGALVDELISLYK